MSELTKRDNFMRAVRRQNPEWVPMNFEWTPEMDPIFKLKIGDADPQEHYDFDLRILGFVEPNCTSDFAEIANSNDPADVDKHDWLALADNSRYEWMPGEVKAYHERGLPVMAGGSNFFENFRGVLGFERFMLEMAEGSPIVKRIFERATEAEIKSAENVTRSGCDIFRCSADFGTQRGPMFSLSMFKEYFFPMMKETIAAAKRVNPDVVVFYHSCGNIEQFIDLFVEAGVDILDPIQPESMDIFELKRRYGNVLTFHGGIGIQSTLLYGTPQEVKDTVKRTIEVMGQGGGYVCAPSHTLQDDIPWENIMAFVEAAREYSGGIA